MTHFYKSEEGFLCARKQAISHPQLTALPYQHSIRDWVSRDFPDAEYTSSDRTSIHAIDLNVLGITAIQGAKGLGKSKAIAAGIRAVPEATVLFITFNRALAWASLDILGERGKLYSDISGCIVPAAHPRVCLVVNSTNRVEPGYDIVVIDEIVSVMTNISGNLLTNELRTAVLKALVKIITAAKCIVVADAMLDAACLRFLLMCRGGAVPLRVLDYTHRVHAHYQYMAHAYLETWNHMLEHSLRSGKNVAVACMTIPMVEDLRARYDGVYTMISYTAGDDPEVLATHMREGINKHWQRCQLLVYSPVITAGCSFEMQHFDLIFFYGIAGMASARTANQMISRIRDIALQTVHVYIKPASKTPQVGAGRSPETGFSGYSSVMRTAARTTEGVLPSQEQEERHKHMLLLHQLWTFKEHERRVSAVAFPYTFWSFVVFSGATITFQRADLWAEVPEALRVAEDWQGVSRHSGGAHIDEMPLKPDTITHCWDTAVHMKTPGIRIFSGQTLQRAGLWHVEHACAMGALDGIALKVMPARVPRLHHVGTTGARTRAWDLLVAQNAISRRRSLEEVIVRSGRRKVFSYANVIGCGTKTVFPLIAEMYAADVQLPHSDGIVAACRNAATTAVAELNDARLDELWLLAAVDVTVRARVATLVPKMVLEPRPENLGLARANTIEQAVCMAVFNEKDPSAYWVGVNVVLGTAMVADVVLVQPTTKELHIYIFRAAGRAALVYDFDVLKGLALCACVGPSGLKCMSVTFVYLKTFEAVELDVSRWTSRRCFMDFLNTKGRLPNWNVMQSVVLVFFDGAEGAMSARFPNGDRIVYKTVEAVFRGVSEFAVGSFIKLVSWGFRNVYDEKYTRRVFDLEYIIGSRMDHVFDPTQSATATIRNAMPLSEPCNDNDSMAGIDKLFVLYSSVIQKGAVVFFKDTTPTSVDVYSMGSVAFLEAQGKPLRYTETHTM